MHEGVDKSYGLFSNFIYHELSLKTLNQEVIDSIILTSINKKAKKVADIKFDGGFNPENQKYILIAYNNGDSNGNVGNIELEVLASKVGTFEKKELYKGLVTEDQVIESGTVMSIHIQDLLEFKNFFLENTEYSDLLIRYRSSTVKIFGYYRRLEFDRNNGNFTISMVHAPSSPQRPVPFLNLSSNDSEVKVQCSETISEGCATIGFNIYVDKSCLLTYKVKLMSGRTKIKSPNIHQINIRIPKYNQEYSQEFGIFNSFVATHNPNYEPFIYTLEDIRTRKKELIFDKKKAAEQYSNVKFK